MGAVPPNLCRGRQDLLQGGEGPGPGSAPARQGLPSEPTLGGPGSPQRQVFGRGLGQAGRAPIARTGHRPCPGASVGSAAPCALPATPEGGPWHSPAWTRAGGGIIFPSQRISQE